MVLELLLGVTGVFFVVALTAGSLTYWWLARNAPEQRRLRAFAQPGGSGVVIGGPTALTETPDPVLQRLSRLVPKSPKDMTRIQRRLARAGHPHPSAAVYYALAEVTLPVVLGLSTIVLFGMRGGLLLAVFLAILGYLAPGLWVERQTRLRQKAIRNGLPDALDLLTVCVEAGSGLDQALAKTSNELHHVHPALADELQTINTEIRAGKPRMEALKNFAQRTGVPDVQTLVSMLTQTDRFGTSVADALRVQSDTSRTKRRQDAEERAGKVGVKLVFPLALCLFPALYVVCFGPVVVKVYRAFLEGAP